MPHHARSIDRWDDATGSNVYEHLAGVNEPPPRPCHLRRHAGRAPRSPCAARIIEKTWPADD
jgi:hypothetical protein